MAPRAEAGLPKYGSININAEEAEPLVSSFRLNSESDKSKKWIAPIALAAGFLVVAVTLLHKRGHGTSLRPPFQPGDAMASPVSMGLTMTGREEGAAPSKIWGNLTGPFPTNSWYLVSQSPLR